MRGISVVVKIKLPYLKIEKQDINAKSINDKYLNKVQNKVQRELIRLYIVRRVCGKNIHDRWIAKMI